MSTLENTARALVAPGKGILAADESAPTIKKRFDSIGVESTEDRRRDYREFMFRTAGANEFISGVILFDETLRQNAASGERLVEVLEQEGVIPGIKVDKGAKELAGCSGGSSKRQWSGPTAKRLRISTTRFQVWRIRWGGASIPIFVCLAPADRAGPSVPR